MSDLVECPFCEYAAENEKSLRGHVSGKKDNAHSGHTYDELTEELSGGSESSTTTDDSGSSGSGSGAVSFPSADDSGSSSGCPDCGSEDYYTPSQVREAGLTAEELDEYDRVCAECGELYNA